MTTVRFDWTDSPIGALVLAVSILVSTPSLAADEGDADDRAGELSKPARRPQAGALRFGLDPLLIEAARLTNHPQASNTFALRTQWYLIGKTTPSIEWRTGLRLDGDAQQGGATDSESTKAQLGDTYLRWRGGDTRLTAGMQTVVWGRVDAVSLIDRVARVDLRRFALDELKDRRLPQPALRWEQEWGPYKSDLIWLAGFHEALMPADGSVWHPVNRGRAQVLGIDPMPNLAPFYAAAVIDQVNHQSGGGALRITHAGAPFDYGFTLGRVRQSLPHFQFDPVAGRIRSSHPTNRFASVDFEISGDAATWRGEVAYTRDVPMTSLAGQTLTAASLEAAAGVEFFPGGRDTRVNLQMLLRSVNVGQDTYELQRYASINGEVESSFDQGRWKASLRFAGGLNINDSYLSPRLTFVGWEPHELYIAVHRFSGEPRGFGGFMRNNSAVAIGVKTRF